ncbi:hypothetical protein ACLESO_28765, partial [Pyxidicoccus sp. 3LG]
HRAGPGGPGGRGAPGGPGEELRRVVGLTLDRLVAELGAVWLQEGRLDPIASAVLPMESSPVP